MSQNKYYWGVVLQVLSEWSGHEPEELHDYFKTQFLEECDRDLPGGTRISVHPSTRALEVEEFSAYVERVKRWAAGERVYIPDPNEVLDA